MAKGIERGVEAFCATANSPFDRNIIIVKTFIKYFQV
jgi:hypothetical protein